jgi:hypothetical protein
MDVLFPTLFVQTVDQLMDLNPGSGAPVTGLSIDIQMFPFDLQFFHLCSLSINATRS